MKQILLILCIFLVNVSFGQSLIEQLKKVENYQQVDEFTTNNPHLQVETFIVTSPTDTSKLQKQFYGKKTGDIFTLENITYKVLHDTTAAFSRVNYIYLDGTSLSASEIDSIRNYIIEEFKNGVPFDSLSVQFNMDGNPNFGDTNWFSDEMMVKEFADAIKLHSISEVFTVDVAPRNWFYVVKKTYETRKARQMRILSVKNSD